MKNTIKRIIAGDYNDYHKSCYYTTFEIIDELPKFGTYDGKDIIKIEEVRLDGGQYSTEYYNCYKITAYNEEWEDEEEFYVAIKKNYEESEDEEEEEEDD